MEGEQLLVGLQGVDVDPGQPCAKGHHKLSRGVEGEAGIDRAHVQDPLDRSALQIVDQEPGGLVRSDQLLFAHGNRLDLAGQLSDHGADGAVALGVEELDHPVRKV